MEPAAKRRRRVKWPPDRTTTDNDDDDDDDDELASEPLQVSARRDPDLRLTLERAYADNRFQATMAHIFDKYSRNFDGIGDEIDLATGEIVVNNGHLQNMRHEADVGIPPSRHPQDEAVPEEEEEEEEDRIMHGRELDRHPLDSSGPVARPGRSHLEKSMVTFPSRPHPGRPRHLSSSSRAPYLASSSAHFTHSPLAFASSPLALGPWALQSPSLSSSLAPPPWMTTARRPSQLLAPAPSHNGTQAPSRLSIWAPGYRFQDDDSDPPPSSSPLLLGPANPWARAKGRLMKFILPRGMRESQSDDDLDEDAILAGRSFRSGPSPTGASTGKKKKKRKEVIEDDDDILTSGLAPPPRTASVQQGLQLVRWRPAQPTRTPHSGRSRTMSQRVQKQLPGFSASRFRSAQKLLRRSPAGVSSSSSSSTALVRQGPRPAADGQKSNEGWRRRGQHLVVEVPSEPRLGRQAYEWIEAPVEEVADSADDEMDTGSLGVGQAPAAATMSRHLDRPRAARRSLPALVAARMAPQSAPSLSDDEMPIPCQGQTPRGKPDDGRPASLKKRPNEGGHLEAEETAAPRASAIKTGPSRVRKETEWLRETAPAEESVENAVRSSPSQAPRGRWTGLCPGWADSRLEEERWRKRKCGHEKEETTLPTTTPRRCQPEKDERTNQNHNPPPLPGPKQDKSPATKPRRRMRSTASSRSLLSLLAPDDSSSSSSSDELARRSAASTGPPPPSPRPQHKPCKVPGRTGAPPGCASLAAAEETGPCGRDGTYCGRDFCFTCL